MGTDIEDPVGENVHHMDENNISKYRSDPTVEGGVITVGLFAICLLFSLFLNSLLLLQVTPREKI